MPSDTITGQDALRQMGLAMATNAIDTIDLTHTLDPDFPVLVLPPELGQCACFRMEEVSSYDERGPAWKWHTFTCSEHTGTHFDAPSHWICGRDLPANSVDAIPVKNFVGPVCVIDCSAGARDNADYELTPEVITQWEADHGQIPQDSWVLMRTDWLKRSGEAYLNMHKDGLQCLRDLDLLPPTGANLIGAPLKIRNGTGSPLRVLALVASAQ